MKYALDTDVFIDGFRSEEAQADVFAFLNRTLPFTYLSAVVMQELAAGARTPQADQDVQQGIFEPFERRRRVFTPSAAAFAESGRVVAALAGREGWQLFDEKPSLLNDALIAVSCREQGIMLITNDGDFKRLLPLVKGFRVRDALASDVDGARDRIGLRRRSMSRPRAGGGANRRNQIRVAESNGTRVP